METSSDGRIKLYLIYRTLNFRRENPELFADGTYFPLEAGGEKKDHVIAFSRAYGRREILVAAPRLVAGLTGGEERAPLGKEVWGDTRLLRGSQNPGQTYRNLFTGEMISAGTAGKASGLGLAEIFAAFPVALLEAVGG